MGKVLTLEEVEKRIYIRHGDKITMSNYVNCAQDLAHFKCNVCDREWDNYPYIVYGKKGGVGCARCNGAIRYTIEEVKKIVENRGSELISKRYYSNGKKLKIKFQCGHIHSITLRDFISGKRCPCMYPSEKRQRTIEKTNKKVIEELSMLGFEIVSIITPEGGIRGVRVEYYCNNGHYVENQLFATIMVLKSCKMCSAERVIKLNIGSGKYDWKNRSKMLAYIRKTSLKDWYKNSRDNSNHTCVISGKKSEIVHHLYPFNLILHEALFNLNLKENVDISKLSRNKKVKLIEEIKNVHLNYPLGVCLTKELHIEFHKLYGLSNFTPEDFYDFQKMKEEV